MYNKRLKYPSASGEHEIHAYIWFPKDLRNIKGIVQLVHGMFEHMVKYEETARFFADNGFIVCGNEHCGHGDSLCRDKVYGYMGEKDGWKSLIKDVRTLTTIMKNDYPNHPYFLFGHSMGSFIVRAYFSIYNKQANEINGAIICGTAEGNRGYKYLSKASNAGVKIFGSKKESKAIGKIMKRIFNRGIESHTGMEWVTSDVNLQNFLWQDERMKFDFTYEGYRELFQLMYLISDKRLKVRIRKDLPILIISGERDPVGMYSKSVKRFYNSLIHQNICDATLKIYPSVRHDLTSEVNRDKVFRDVYYWMCRQLD